MTEEEAQQKAQDIVDEACLPIHLHWMPMEGVATP